jgi:hypothetical protein
MARVREEGNPRNHKVIITQNKTKKAPNPSASRNSILEMKDRDLMG